MRRFHLYRKEDVSGVSGTGVVAEGIEFSDGVVCLHWTGEWPASVVHYDRGMAAVEAVHGHDGRTKIIWYDKKSPIDVVKEARERSMARHPHTTSKQGRTK